MAYTKNYYTILGLAPPAPTRGTAASPQSTSSAVRTAYRTALLAAHPDKASAKTATQTQTQTQTQSQTHSAYTIDDVKEAYTVLSSPASRADYDAWLALHPAVLRGAGNAGSAGAGGGGSAADEEFVLGLEVLDLSDFAEEDEGGMEGGRGNEGEEEEEGEMLWTRACRCGDDRGFRIREGELVDAEARGEKEVLVGCCGCSLWVRVAFEVEEG